MNMDDLYSTDPMHDFYNTEQKEEIHEYVVQLIFRIIARKSIVDKDAEGIFILIF